jgi:hypothetical protein
MCCLWARCLLAALRVWISSPAAMHLTRTQPGLRQTTSPLRLGPNAATTEQLPSDRDGSITPGKPPVGLGMTQRRPCPVRSPPDEQNRLHLQPRCTEEPSRHGIRSWFQSSEEPPCRIDHLRLRLTGVSRPGGLLAGLGRDTRQCVGPKRTGPRSVTSHRMTVSCGIAAAIFASHAAIEAAFSEAILNRRRCCSSVSSPVRGRLGVPSSGAHLGLGFSRG